MWFNSAGVQSVVVRPIPRNSRSIIISAINYVEDNLVTSQIVFDECKTYVDAEWPLFAKEQPVAC